MPASRPYWKGFLKLSFVSCPIALYPAPRRRSGFPSASQPAHGPPPQAQARQFRHRRGRQSSNKARGYEVGEKRRFCWSRTATSRGREVQRPARPVRWSLSKPSRRESPPIVSAGPHGKAAEGAAPDDDDEVEEQEEAVTFSGPQNTRTIEIERFLPVGEMNARYFEKPYYILPREEISQEILCGDPRCDAPGGRYRLGSHRAVFARAAVSARADGQRPARRNVALRARSPEQLGIFWREFPR